MYVQMYRGTPTPTLPHPRYLLQVEVLRRPVAPQYHTDTQNKGGSIQCSHLSPLLFVSTTCPAVTKGPSDLQLSQIYDMSFK